MSSLSRRSFLKLSAFGALGLAFRYHPSGSTATLALARIAVPELPLFAAPSLFAPTLRTLAMDEVLPITGRLSERVGESDVDAGADAWLKVYGGWVEAGKVQQVSHRPNAVPLRPGRLAAFGEVTVPFVDAHLAPDPASPFAFRLYYRSVYPVAELLVQGSGQGWYRLIDDRSGESLFAPSESIRLLRPAEFTPLSPDVPLHEKAIEVSLDHQTLTAYERRAPVFHTVISSGRVAWQADPLAPRKFLTPAGEFNVFAKQPSRRMTDADQPSLNGLDFPGVPWVAYFAENGTAFHGTYWHSNFGRPMSHGCINLPPLEAKWLYRWLLPATSPTRVAAEGRGTRVSVA